MLGYPLVFAFDYYAIELLHILSFKRGLQCTHLVKDTAQTPNIGLLIMGQIFPHLRGCVVRRTGLGVTQPSFHNLRHVEVPKFRL